jgi:hypothetical protein
MPDQDTDDSCGFRSGKGHAVRGGSRPGRDLGRGRPGWAQLLFPRLLKCEGAEVPVTHPSFGSPRLHIRAGRGEFQETGKMTVLTRRGAWLGDRRRHSRHRAGEGYISGPIGPAERGAGQLAFPWRDRWRLPAGDILNSADVQVTSMATTQSVSSATHLRDALSVGNAKSSAMRCRKKLRDALSVRSYSRADPTQRVPAGWSARTLHDLPFVPFPTTSQPPGQLRLASLASNFRENLKTGDAKTNPIGNIEGDSSFTSQFNSQLGVNRHERRVGRTDRAGYGTGR